MVFGGIIGLENYDTMSIMSHQKLANRKTRLHGPGQAQEGGCQLPGRGIRSIRKSMAPSQIRAKLDDLWNWVIKWWKARGQRPSICSGETRWCLVLESRGREGTDGGVKESRNWLFGIKLTVWIPAGLACDRLCRLRDRALVPDSILADLRLMTHIPLLEFSRNALTEYWDTIIKCNKKKKVCFKTEVESWECQNLCHTRLWELDLGPVNLRLAGRERVLIEGKDFRAEGKGWSTV